MIRSVAATGGTKRPDILHALFVPVLKLILDFVGTAALKVNFPAGSAFIATVGTGR
jgi:hypothetical protein